MAPVHRLAGWRSRAGSLAALLSLGAPLGAQARWTLVEEWRIGGDAAGPYAFDDVRDVRLDARGNALVLDFKAQQLRLYDRTGRHVRSVGRKGSGPGEFREANGMVVLRDGRVVVNDPSNGRYAVFGPDLTFQRTSAKSIQRYGFQWEAYVDAEGRVVDQVTLPLAGRADETGTGVRRWRPDLETADTIAATQCVTLPPMERRILRFGNEQMQSYHQIPFLLPTRGEVRDRQGALWTADPADSRVIRRYAPGTCTVTATVTLAGASRAVSAAERAEALAPLENAAKQYNAPKPDPAVIPRVHPAFDRVHVDPANRLWVERVTPDGQRTRFEVYDATGKPVATAEVPRVRFGYIAPDVGSDRVLAFAYDADDILHLVSWRIQR